MVIKLGGFRRKTRSLLRKDVRSKGKIRISRFFATYKIGEKVLLGAEPAYQKGMYFPRYYGKVGLVQEKRGDCYVVEIKDRSVSKMLIVHPVHLSKA